MLAWIVTIVLILIALSGWLFLKTDPDRYIHEKKSPINFFFKFGRFYHHVFKVVIIILFMVIIFSLYRYILRVSEVFSLIASLGAGIILSSGKELLDKAITRDDVITSLLGITLGFSFLYLFF